MGQFSSGNKPVPIECTIEAPDHCEDYCYTVLKRCNSLPVTACDETRCGSSDGEKMASLRNALKGASGSDHASGCTVRKILEAVCIHRVCCSTLMYVGGKCDNDVEDKVEGEEAEGTVVCRAVTVAIT